MPTSQVGLLGAVAQLHVKRSFTSFPDSLRQLLKVKEQWIIDINVQARPWLQRVHYEGMILSTIVRRVLSENKEKRKKEGQRRRRSHCVYHNIWDDTEGKKN